MTEVIDKLTQAKTRLSLTEPFFSTILYRFPMQETDLVPIAAVTPRGLILYNPKAIENLTVLMNCDAIFSWDKDGLISG